MSNQDPLTNGLYWGPVGETAAEIQLEKLFLTSGYLIGLTFGMLSMLYLACMRILVQGKRTRYSYFLMGYSTLLWLNNLMSTTTAYIGLELAYIENRNYPGGIARFLAASAVIPSNVVTVSGLVIGGFLNDVLLLWRVQIIWLASVPGRTRANVALLVPGIMVLASLALGIVWNFENSSPGGIYVESVVKIALAYFSLSLASNLAMTGMIVYRIWSFQRLIRQSLGGGNDSQYTFIMTMFVESAALYAIMSILVLGTFAAESTVSEIFLGIAPGIQLISSYFIIWRVADGRALSRETMTAPGSSLRFCGANAITSRATSATGLTFSTNPSHTTALSSVSARELEVSVPCQELGDKGNNKCERV